MARNPWVNVRLLWFLEGSGFLSPSQSGFWKLRCATNNLIRLETLICEAFTASQHLLAVFFDFEKAYATAWHYGIRQQLHVFGMCDCLSMLIRDLHTDLVFRVHVGSSFSAPHLQEGVPQGSILSMPLFAVATSGINSLPVGVSSSLCVDYLAVWYAGSRMPAVERRLQVALDKVSAWEDSRSFHFPTSKTISMHFCRIGGVDPDPDLLAGRRLQCMEETRFLGLVFDCC